MTNEGQFQVIGKLKVKRSFFPLFPQHIQGDAEDGGGYDLQVVMVISEVNLVSN